jgi:hypothetical protein
MNRIQSEERRNGQLAMGYAWYYIHRQGPDHQQLVLHGVIGAFKRSKQEKRHHLKQKVLFHQDNASCHNQNVGKIA